jgi:hypothetical protein
MKNVVPLPFSPVPQVRAPEPLKEVLIVNIPLFTSSVSISRAAAPKLNVYLGERICNIV